MIIGGIGGVFRVGPGGSKVGYSETFFPIAVDAASESSVNSLISATTPIKISAIVKIANDAGIWVNIGDVTYASVTLRADGTGTATLTIANSKKWSVAGDIYPELLRPSYRQIQILVTLRSGGATYENTLFLGVIETYSESHGQRNGTITISAKTLSNATAARMIKGLKRHTVYRKIYDECMASGLFAAGQFPVMFIDDVADVGAGAVESQYLTADTLLSAMIYNLIAYPTQAVRDNGGLRITFQTQIADVAPVSTYEVSDAVAVSITRSVGGATSYNTVVVQGMFNGGLMTQVYSDASDVEKRGIFQSPTVYGDPNTDLSTNLSSAIARITDLLRDRLSIQLRLNPWLTPNTQLKVTSDRLFMTDRLSKIGNVTHVLDYRTATTTLSDVAVLEDD